MPQFTGFQQLAWDISIFQHISTIKSQKLKHFPFARPTRPSLSRRMVHTAMHKPRALGTAMQQVGFSSRGTSGDRRVHSILSMAGASNFKRWETMDKLNFLNEPLRTEFMMAELSPLGIASPRGRELYRLLCLPNALCRASRVAKDHRWRRVAFAERVRQKASELAWSWDELSRIFRGVSPRSSPVHHLKYQVLPSIYPLKLSSFLVCPIFFRTHRAIVFGGSGLWHVPRVVI